jgi:hypothetical protein
MNSQRRWKRMSAFKHRLQILRPQYIAALHAMEYEQALICQMEIDDLQRELDALRPPSDHVRLMDRQRYDYDAAPPEPR